MSKPASQQRPRLGEDWVCSTTLSSVFSRQLCYTTFSFPKRSGSKRTSCSERTRVCTTHFEGAAISLEAAWYLKANWSQNSSVSGYFLEILGVFVFLISHSDSQQLNVISAFAENTKETTGGNATHLFNHLNPRPSKKKTRQKGFDELAAAKQTQADGRATHIPTGSKKTPKNKETVGRLLEWICKFFRVLQCKVINPHKQLGNVFPFQ